MKLSVLIITRNEDKMLKKCIQSVGFADEIIVIDSYSSDKTADLARRLGAKVYKKSFVSFDDQRNFALGKAKGEWVLYLDADERLDKHLQKSIQKAVQQKEKSAYRLLRKNYYYKNCEWPYIEHIVRLFYRKHLLGWKGKVHEHPIYKGETGKLPGYILHHTHRDLSTMIEKTISYAELESDLLFEANHPMMNPIRFIRIMIDKFYYSYFKQRGWKAGVYGLIESIYQAYSYFIIYARLWEKQKKKN